MFKFKTLTLEENIKFPKEWNFEGAMVVFQKFYIKYNKVKKTLYWPVSPGFPSTPWEPNIPLSPGSPTIPLQSHMNGFLHPLHACKNRLVALN